MFLYWALATLRTDDDLEQVFSRRDSSLLNVLANFFVCYFQVPGRPVATCVVAMHGDERKDVIHKCCGTNATMSLAHRSFSLALCHAATLHSS